jgi:hypothetical protein
MENLKIDLISQPPFPGQEPSIKYFRLPGPLRSKAGTSTKAIETSDKMQLDSEKNIEKTSKHVKLL